MYNAIIDNGETYLYLDTGTEDVYDGIMSGFLINNENIINLMELMPIKQYYVRTNKNIKRKITKEQANYKYQKLIDYNKVKKEEINRVF